MTWEEILASYGPNGPMIPPWVIQQIHGWLQLHGRDCTDVMVHFWPQAEALESCRRRGMRPVDRRGPLPPREHARFVRMQEFARPEELEALRVRAEAADLMRKLLQALRLECAVCGHTLAPNGADLCAQHRQCSHCCPDCKQL